MLNFQVRKGEKFSAGILQEDMMYLVLAFLPSHSPTAIFSKETVIIYRLWGRGSENCWDHMGSWGTEWELGISCCQLPVRGDDKNISEPYGGSGKFVVTQTSSDPPPPLPGDFMNNDQSLSNGFF